MAPTLPCRQGIKPNWPLAGVKWSSLAIFFIAYGANPSVWAQPAERSLAPVVVRSGATPASPEVFGLGDTALRDAPLSATVIGPDALRNTQARRLADLYQLDASVSDAYNTVGYIDYATVRGFVINNQYNLRREGLPISGDTAIGLANKARVDILKGTSGIQAGVSAPGGLLNYAVKRPTAQPLRELSLSIDSHGQLGAALDVGGRFGPDQAHGYRLNAATDRLRADAPGTRGQRQQLALALDTRPGPDSILEAEMELSHQAQPTQPGLSVLGATGVLPAPNPRLNLNQQPWTAPTVFDGLTGSLRFQQALGADWRWSAQLGAQRLKTDDRVAFPYGCGNAGTGSCNAYYDTGDYDLYDYRSDGERRRALAAQLQLQGDLHWGGARHALGLALLRSQAHSVLPDYAYNYVGTANLATSAAFTPDPSLIAGTGSTRRQHSTELSLVDAIHWSPQLTTWLGLRHTRLAREDSASNTRYQQGFSTPWLAASYRLGAATLYASHGQGMESAAVPRLPAYGVAAGQALPALRSRQTELGAKGGHAALGWSIAWFQISRPLVVDDGSTVQMDGAQRHSGLEASAHTQAGPWRLGAAASVLRAQQTGAVANAALNGLRPANVPSHILRLNAAYRLANGLQLGAHVSHEGRRAILPDNSLQLPAWTRLDASLRYDTRLGDTKASWHLGINNLLDKRYYKESPYQFGHAYLFPGAARSLRASVVFTL